MPKNKNWTSGEHAKLLVAIIKTGKPTVDTKQIAAYLGNGRTACAVYFEIRRLKMLAEGGGSGPVKKRPHQDFQQQSPDPTLVKAEPRPVRATRPSAAKRRYDEVADSGFWDESDNEGPAMPVKRAKGPMVKFEDDSGDNEDVSASATDGGIEAEA